MGEGPSFEKIQRRSQNIRRGQEEAVASQTSIDPLLITSKMGLATSALRERLANRLLGSDMPGWIPDCAAIYEKALVALAIHIQAIPIPEQTRRSALNELVIGAEALARLFADQIPLKDMEEISTGKDTFEGYFNYPEEAGNRLIVDHQGDYVLSERLGRKIRPNCQIKIKDIHGLSPGGKAVAGPDCAIRIGLRYGMVDAKNRWTVSVESGAKDPEKKWKIIGPLSQAINYCYLDGPNFLTYHYSDPDFISLSNKATISWFIFFNNTLGSILRESIRPHNHLPLADGCPWWNRGRTKGRFLRNHRQTIF
ncbi:MAG: hypothetical protein UU67_C0008G0018 [Candidatus Daviesbacteria bacterium GW2011_GWB1_41_5]|nr:MAG: hypothetical protein UU67_C0008G0018 [Candidatus Daviesbacteria bacterium GW2011_GWB1_41_5]